MGIGSSAGGWHERDQSLATEPAEGRTNLANRWADYSFRGGPPTAFASMHGGKWETCNGGSSCKSEIGVDFTIPALSLQRTEGRGRSAAMKYVSAKG
jgi:hypothetical protein